MHDYSKLGFKAGLEIHQQLDIGSKLFCRCPAYLRSDKPNVIIRRRLHPVAGESGEVDIAAAHEASFNKEFIYEGYSDSNCLLEYDDSPPYEISQTALDEALKIALLLNCEIYPVTQIMRKMVIDGSNTSGFQRSVLIAHDGFIETSFGKVRVDTLCVEEDSARIIEKDAGKAVYRLDRLGIPLIEIATAPDMMNPEQVKEAALKIGEILRACKVKRGIGTIRQDVNVSVKGHGRVEIKGFQDPAMMVKTIDKEIERQLLAIKEGKTNGEVRNALDDGTSKFMRPMPGKDRMYPETDLPLLKIGRDKLNALKKNLPKLRHEIKAELKKKGLSDELINLVLDEGLDEFNVLMKVHSNYENQDSQTLGFRKPSRDANLVAKMITLWRNEFATKQKKSFEQIKEVLNEVVLEKVLENVRDGKINDGDVKQVLLKVVNGENVEDALKVERIDENKLEEEIAKIVKEKPGATSGAYMGMIISKLGTGIDKRKAMEILNKSIM